MTARLAWIKADTEDPMLAASDGCMGLALVMWTIRKCVYSHTNHMMSFLPPLPPSFAYRRIRLI